MRDFVSLISGALFGAGLHVSGMTDTAKVRGFLDVFGAWDPTLAFVMGGALIPMTIAWRLAGKRSAPLAGGHFPQNVGHTLDKRLIVGSVLFGVGWGLVGLCPGPAIASLSYGGWSGAVFFVAMAIGMLASPRLSNAIPSTSAT